LRNKRISYSLERKYNISTIKAKRAINSDGANRGEVDEVLKSAEQWIYILI
jgi:hypothetical protein